MVSFVSPTPAATAMVQACDLSPLLLHELSPVTLAMDQQPPHTPSFKFLCPQLLPAPVPGPPPCPPLPATALALASGA